VGVVLLKHNIYELGYVTLKIFCSYFSGELHT